MLKNSGLKFIFLILLIFSLISIVNLVKELSIYLQKNWQMVEGEGIEGEKTTGDFFTVDLLEKEAYPDEHWDVIRHGILFLKPELTENEKPALPQIPKLSIPVSNKTPSEPVCPWKVVGVMVGNMKKAILFNTQNNQSVTIGVGEKLDDFVVEKISIDYVILKNSEIEFKLKLGGS